MKKALAIFAVAALFAGSVDAKPGKRGKHGKKHRHSVSRSVAVGVPPGLAKKGGLPPGLAKRLVFPARAPRYVVIDPRYDDRLWYLAGDRWVLRDRFDLPVRREVRLLLADPYIPVPPPIPLPVPAVSLRVYLFD